MQTYMKEASKSSVTFQMTLHSYKGATKKLSQAGREQISTCIDTLDLLLKSYETNPNIAKTTSRTTQSKKTWRETSRKLADIFQANVTWWKIVYPDKQNKAVLINQLKASIQSIVPMF